VHPVVDDYFGNKVTDPYRWMEAGPADPKFLAFLHAQSDYTRSVLAPLRAPRQRLLERIEQLDNAVAAVSSPSPAGGRVFFRQTDPGARTSSLMLRDAAGHVRKLLDPERFSTASAHAAMDYFVPSDDGSRVAVGVSLGGSENSTIHVIDTQTGRLWPDAISRCQYAGVSWRDDGKSFYYARLQALKPGAPPSAIYENERTFLHVLGRAPERDPAVFGAGVAPGLAVPKAGFTGVGATPGCPYVLASYSAGTTDPGNIYLADGLQAVDARTPWRPIVKSDDGLAVCDSNSAVHGTTLYLLMRNGTPNRRLIALDLRHPDIARAPVLLPESDLVLEGIYAAQDALYVVQRDGVNFKLARLRYGSQALEPVPLPYAGAILEVATDVLRPGAVFVLGAWTKAPATFRYDPQAAAVREIPIMPRPKADFSAIDPREVTVSSTDGAQVPLTILCRHDLTLDGSHTTLFEGYGAYGDSYDPTFLPRRLAWLERGDVLAYVHTRGGGEFGEKWHLAGQKATKQHTIDDMVAAARYLTDNGYSTAAHLCVRGTSAGGVAVGGAIVQHPELFVAAIDNVGMTDLLRFQTTQGGAANIPEFGDVTRQDQYHWLLDVSPYAHVVPQTRYPAVMGITGVHDPRVPSWMVAKFISALQVDTSSGRPVLLRVDFDAGHGLGSSRTQFQEETADEWSFLLWQSGDPDFQP
jgi:prolyl oligopeptidase